MDTIEGAILKSISNHLGHQQDMASMQQMMQAMSTASNLCIIQSSDGKNIYATGMRPDFNVARPTSWEDVEESIPMQSFVINNQVQSCPIEQVNDLELRVGGRVARFADASRTMCGQWNPTTGKIGYYYIFDNFVPENGHEPAVEVIVTVAYRVRPEVLVQRKLNGFRGTGSPEEFFAATHPSRFSTGHLIGPVSLDESLTFLPAFEIEDADNDEEAEDDDGNNEGGRHDENGDA